MRPESELGALEADLVMLKDLYEDGDRQDAELRNAIRKQREAIKALKEARRESRWVAR